MAKPDNIKDEILKQRQVWYLPKPWILEELYSRKLILFAMGAICLTLLLLLIWASIARIDESAIALGEVSPIGSVRVVQHLEGGIVEKVNVKDGQSVKANTPLLKLNNVGFKAELKQLQVRQSALKLDAKRLTAYTKNHDIDQTGVNKNDKAHIEEQALLVLQQKSRIDQVAVVNAQIEQKEKEISRLKEQIRLTTINVKLLAQEENMFKKLTENGTVAHREYLQVQRSRNESEKELFNFKTQYEQSEDVLKEAHSERAKILSTLNETAAKELDSIKTELQEVVQAIIKLEDRVARSIVRAPIDGIVKGLDATVGKVISPNGEILTIVPQDAQLQITARVQPVDIGHIKVGDAATIKIFAYDFARYGAIKGKVIGLSASTFLDEKKKPYYQAMISLDHQYVGHVHNQLRTGMTAQVDILTGNKTILQYLLKPIHVTLQSSLNER